MLRFRPRPTRFGIVLAAAGLALALGVMPGVSWADETAGTSDPVNGVSGSVQGPGGVPSGPAAEAPSAPSDPTSQPPGAPSDPAVAAQQQADCAGGECPGHDVEEPREPDHAEGTVTEVSIAGDEILTVGRTNATVNDDGSSRGDVVVLAVLGTEIAGAESDSETGPGSNTAGTAVLCDETDGQVCLGLLFASTSSRTGHSDANTTLAFVCVGGEQDQPEQDCTGIVGTGVSSSSSTIDKSPAGSGTATQQTDLADVCVGPGGEVNGICSGIGLRVVHAESTSTVDGAGNASTDHDSFLLALEAGGERTVLLDDPDELAIPPGCPSGGALVCLFINNWDEVSFTGGAGSEREAIHLDLLAGAVQGVDLVLAHLGGAESLVHFAPFGGGAQPPGGDGAGPGLAITGFGTLLPLGLMALLSLAAAGLLGWQRGRAV